MHTTKAVCIAVFLCFEMVKSHERLNRNRLSPPTVLPSELEGKMHSTALITEGYRHDGEVGILSKRARKD